MHQHVPVRDLVLIPVDQVDEASELLRRAGHRVTG
jgi:hypothetical protein